MKDKQPQPKYRRDYRPANYLVERVDLHLDIRSEYTDVTAKMSLRRNPQGQGESLRLDGRHMILQSLSLDGNELPESDYCVDASGITLKRLPETGVLVINN